MRHSLALVLAAVSDAWVVGFGVFTLLFNGLLSLSIWRLTAAQKRTEGLEGRLHELTSKLVDERFRSFSHEINGHVSSFMLTLEDLKLKLREGEGIFASLGQADHSIELKHMQRMEQVKDYIRDHTASKADVREHEKRVEQKLEKLSEQVTRMLQEVAVMAEKCRD